MFVRKEKLNTITISNVTPELNSPISSKSNFSDGVWDFSIDGNERQNSVGDSKLRIEWDRFSDRIPDSSIKAVKVLAFIYIHNVGSLGGRVKKMMKPQTLCLKFENLLNFFSRIYSLKRAKNPDYECHLFDFDARDLQLGLDHYKRQSVMGLRELFSILTIEAVQYEIHRKVGCNSFFAWTAADVKKLSMPLKKASKESARAMVIQEELLQILIINASSDVYWFLKRLGANIVGTYDFVNKNTLRVPEALDVEEAFEDYRQIRLASIDQMVKSKKRQSWTIDLRKMFLAKHKMAVNDFKRELERVQSAAKYLVMQFTGARYSEIITFKKDALCLKDGNFFVKGTIVKGKNERLTVGNDYWVAIPIVRDAIKVLELITSYTLHDYLFASNHGKVLQVKHLPSSDTGVNDNLNRYLISIDRDRKYSGAKGDGRISVYPAYLLSSHRIRHTLANQFHKHRIGLLVTSYHFKHAYFAARFYKIPNEVTLGYGNIGQEIFNSATYAEEVKKQLIESIYSPDAPIAGGGAANFIQTRDAFFNGEIMAGGTPSVILKRLYRRNLPFADVMLGYCGGKDNYLNDSGTMEEPPCIGQCKCNPSRCKNAIIPKSKEPHWKSYLKNNEKLRADPEMTHAYDFLDFHIKEAKAVLQILNSKSTITGA